MDTSEKRLREYVEKDIIYQDYKKSNKEPSDFERFCFVHCRDIENVLNENQLLKEEIEKLNHIIDKQDRDITTISTGNKMLKNTLEEIKKHCESKIKICNETYLDDEYNWNEDLVLDMLSRKIAYQEILDKVKE